MIIYLHRGMAHTSAEREDSAARLEAQGWVRCSKSVWTALRRIDEATTFAVMQREAMQPKPQACGTNSTLYVVRLPKNSFK